MFQPISCSFSGYPSLFISQITKGIATSIPKDKLSSKQHRSKGEGFSQQPWHVQYVRLLSAMRTPAPHPGKKRLQEWRVPSHLLGGPQLLVPLPGSAPGTAAAPAPPPPVPGNGELCLSTTVRVLYTYMGMYYYIYAYNNNNTCPKSKQNILCLK